MIAVTDLSFQYTDGEFRLQMKSLSIALGERVAIIGPSGSGKTTLLKILAGITEPERGRVVIGGTEVTALSDAERRDIRIRNIGFVFQNFELLEYLNVLDNILLPYRINRSLELTADVRDRAVGLANDVGVADKLSRYITQLSHGERQRVSICRALLAQPRVILADEPTGSLDPTSATRVLDTLLEQSEKLQATLIVVTHDHGLLNRFDRTIDFRDFPSEISLAEDVDSPSSGAGT